MLQRQVESLAQHQKKLEAELTDLDARHEERKRRFDASIANFEQEMSKYAKKKDSKEGEKERKASPVKTAVFEEPTSSPLSNGTPTLPVKPAVTPPCATDASPAAPTVTNGHRNGVQASPTVQTPSVIPTKPSDIIVQPTATSTVAAAAQEVVGLQA